MTAESMIEKMARAIAAETFLGGDPVPWEELHDKTKQWALRQALAALTALETPTQGMIEAMFDLFLAGRVIGDKETFRAGFQAAIVAAKEGK